LIRSSGCAGNDALFLERHSYRVSWHMERHKDLFCVETSWHGRNAFCLGNELVRLTTLTGGGHIAEFRFADGTSFPALNPLWVPPWPTIEPYRYREIVHASRYGSLIEGKLLSGIVGHNICLDYFGSPSPEEVKQGLSQHGEAPSARWHKTRLRLSTWAVALTLRIRLPVAGLTFTREIKLRRGESVVYFKETVQNDRKADHFFHWTQHVTLGPPFLSNRDSFVALPGTKGITFPHGYDEGRALLPSANLFRWPKATARSGETIDLARPFIRRGWGFVASVLLDPKKEVGYIAGVNSRERLLIGYCFNRQEFPWVAVWEENCGIKARPWSRRTQARGLEFSTNPIPVPRREAFALGSLFGTPTLSYVPARGRRTVKYLAFLAQVPSGFEKIRDIQLAEGEIRLWGPRSRWVAVSASGLREYNIAS